MRHVPPLAVALVAVLTAAAPTLAQGTTGTLSGSVADEQGGLLPGAAVSAQNTATGFHRSTTTDASGSFSIPGLPVGRYALKVEQAGFAPLVRPGVTVNVAANTTVDFRLGVAVRPEQVTVVAEASLINVRDSGVGEIVTTTQIENLPLNGRQFGNLAALVPGVGLGGHTTTPPSSPSTRRRWRGGPAATSTT